MKFKITSVLLVTLAIALSFTSCKRSQTVAPTTTWKPNPDLVAKEIASSLYKSLTGQMGGTNVNDGIKAPASLVKHSSKSLNDVSSLCGYTLDTAYTSWVARDTDFWTSTKLVFTNTCTANSVNGYIVYDSVKTEVRNSTFINSAINIQKYNVTALDNSFKLVSCNGSVYTKIWNDLSATSTAKEVYHEIEATYNLQGLKINLTNTQGDITEGTATYVSYSKDINPQTGIEGVIINYSGKIEFEGNYKAKLTIDPGHLYTIDFQANTITAL